MDIRNSIDLNSAGSYFRNSRLANSPRYKLRKAIQLAIIEADVQLENLRNWIIKQTNHNVNGLQTQLFHLSMWCDRRFDV